MKKVLVFLEEDLVVPKGGPYGYNYNLFNGLKSIEHDIQIEFLPSTFKEKFFFSEGIGYSIEKKMRFFNPYEKAMLDKYMNYDIIHFHTSRHMYKARKFLEKYKGNVVFTSHSPMLLSMEMKDDASQKSKKFFKGYFERLPIIDEYAFERADIIIYPCEDAEEPYLNEPIYQKAKNSKTFMYMTTGVVDCKEKIQISRSQYRKQHGIPDDAYVVSYVGRHNEVKGYKLLRDAGEEIIKSNKNVYFLIGGNESPLHGLENERWIEIGYTRDPYSLINASDIFVLPNQQTYFDLVFLEVLSIGKRMIVSETGGNKYFRKYKSDHIKYFHNKEELMRCIEKEAESGLDVNNGVTRSIYSEEFTCEKFAQRYIELLRNIL